MAGLPVVWSMRLASTYEERSSQQMVRGYSYIARTRGLEPGYVILHNGVDIGACLYSEEATQFIVTKLNRLEQGELLGLDSDRWSQAPSY